MLKIFNLSESNSLKNKIDLGKIKYNTNSLDSTIIFQESSRRSAIFQYKNNSNYIQVIPTKYIYSLSNAICSNKFNPIFSFNLYIIDRLQDEKSIVVSDSGWLHYYTLEVGEIVDFYINLELLRGGISGKYSSFIHPIRLKPFLNLENYINDMKVMYIKKYLSNIGITTLEPIKSSVNDEIRIDYILSQLPLSERSKVLEYSLYCVDSLINSNLEKHKLALINKDYDTLYFFHDIIAEIKFELIVL